MDLFTKIETSISKLQQKTIKHMMMMLNKKQRKEQLRIELEKETLFPARRLPRDVIEYILDTFYTFNLARYLCRLHDGILITKFQGLRSSTANKFEYKMDETMEGAQTEYLLNMYGYFKYDSRRTRFLLFKNMDVTQGIALPRYYCTWVLAERYLCLSGGLKRIYLDGLTSLSRLLMEQTKTTLEELTGVRYLSYNIECITNVKCPKLWNLQFLPSSLRDDMWHNGQFEWNLQFLPSSLRVLHLPVLYDLQQYSIDYLNQSKIEQLFVQYLGDINNLLNITSFIIERSESLIIEKRLENLQSLIISSEIDCSTILLTSIFLNCPNLEHLEANISARSTPATYNGSGKLISLILHVHTVTKNYERYFEKSPFIIDVINSNPNLTNLSYPLYMDAEILSNMNEDRKLKRLNGLFIASENIDWNKLSQVFSCLNHIVVLDMPSSILAKLLQTMSLSSLTIDHIDNLYGFLAYSPCLIQYGQSISELGIDFDRLIDDKGQPMRDLVLALPNLKRLKVHRERITILYEDDLRDTTLEHIEFKNWRQGAERLKYIIPPTLQTLHLYYDCFGRNLEIGEQIWNHVPDNVDCVIHAIRK
jgi:hypothetical protein